MNESSTTAPGKQEWVYSDLRAQLESGRRRPGDRLVIAQLAEEFGISVIPVREAIRRLEAEGWVTFRAHVGAEVAGISREDWAAAAELLAVLEGQATALAAPLLSRDEVAELRALNARMESALGAGDIVAFLALNRAFHGRICNRCGNGWLTRMIDEIQPRFEALGPTSIRPRTRAVLAEHDELIALIERGADASAIEAAARRHKLNTLASYNA